MVSGDLSAPPNASGRPNINTTLVRQAVEEIVMGGGKRSSISRLLTLFAFHSTDQYKGISCRENRSTDYDFR